MKKLLAGGEGWETVEDSEKIKEIAHALSDPIRLAILKLLDGGMIRQTELLKAISKAAGRDFNPPLLRYHLSLLERAGLVKSVPDPSLPRVKIVYKSADFRIQVRVREAPSLEGGVRTAEEFEQRLREILGKK